MMYLFCYFLLELGAWAVGYIKTNIALDVEEPADSVGVISELVLTVSEIGTKTGDDL